MKKHLHHDRYSTTDTVRAESALLTAWPVIERFHDDIVVVGGLVPRYICKVVQDGLPPVTLDVDVGVALALSSGLYDTLSTRLGNAGFALIDKRFQIQKGNVTLYLDLLTDKPTPTAADSAMVDDVPVSAVYGVQRAIDLARRVSITGHNMYGAEVKVTFRVCEVGPFACLKLQAYADRHASKDIFDFVRAIRDYDGGTSAAVAAFHAERGKNLAFDVAMNALNTHFRTPTATGPVQYANFCFGGHSSRPDDDTQRSAQFANEAHHVAQLILETGATP